MAERVGFEPTVRQRRTLDFESSAFDHSATFPVPVVLRHASAAKHVIIAGIFLIRNLIIARICNAKYPAPTADSSIRPFRKNSVQMVWLDRGRSRISSSCHKFSLAFGSPDAAWQHAKIVPGFRAMTLFLPVCQCRQFVAENAP